MNNRVKIVHFSVTGNKDKYFYLKFSIKCYKSGYRMLIPHDSPDMLKRLPDRLFSGDVANAQGPAQKQEKSIIKINISLNLMLPESRV